MNKHQVDMNKTFFLRKEDRDPRWRLIDASGEVVGRLATKIANILRGKDKPSYTSHTDSGDYVIVINAEKIVFTGDKMRDKVYARYTNHIGGYKTTLAKEAMAKDPAFILTHAIKGMLGSTKMAHAQIKKLRVYGGSEHGHEGQLSGRLAHKES